MKTDPSQPHGTESNHKQHFKRIMTAVPEIQEKLRAERKVQHNIGKIMSTAHYFI